MLIANKNKLPTILPSLEYFIIANLTARHPRVMSPLLLKIHFSLQDQPMSVISRLDFKVFIVIEWDIINMWLLKTEPLSHVSLECFQVTQNIVVQLVIHYAKRQGA